MTALGRQETWEDSPEGYPPSRPYKWWNWHESYVPDAAPGLKGSRCRTLEGPPFGNATAKTVCDRQVATALNLPSLLLGRPLGTCPDRVREGCCNRTVS
jgi:hypothetical protein